MVYHIPDRTTSNAFLQYFTIKIYLPTIELEVLQAAAIGTVACKHSTAKFMSKQYRYVKKENYPHQHHDRRTDRWEDRWTVGTKVR